MQLQKTGSEISAHYLPDDQENLVNNLAYVG
jgi:hypothetical protein